MYERETEDTTETYGIVTGTTPLLLSVPQAARLLGIGMTLCWEMVHAGDLPSVRLGRRVLIPRAAVERLAYTNEHPTPHAR